MTGFAPSFTPSRLGATALARSIVYRPQLLLLDEPLSNLDAKLRLRLRLRDDLRVMASSASSNSGRGGEALLLHALDPADKVRIALRPENIGIGRPAGVNTFPARVLGRRYQGTQTVYDIDLFGARLEALEFGTAARHQIGVETSVALPREGLWAYRDTGPSSYD